ncbi:unannotated protein [freshwater metagenome]
MARISKIMRGQNLDAVLELESLKPMEFADAEPIISELPTEPSRPVDPKFLTPIEQLEALAFIELEKNSDQDKDKA